MAGWMYPWQTFISPRRIEFASCMTSTRTTQMLYLQMMEFTLLGPRDKWKMKTPTWNVWLTMPECDSPGAFQALGSHKICLVCYCLSVNFMNPGLYPRLSIPIDLVCDPPLYCFRPYLSTSHPRDVQQSKGQILGCDRLECHWWSSICNIMHLSSKHCIIGKSFVFNLGSDPNYALSHISLLGAST